MQQWIEQEGTKFKDKTLWTGSNYWWLHDIILRHVEPKHYDLLVHDYVSYWMDRHLVTQVIHSLGQLDWGPWLRVEQDVWEGLLNQTFQGMDRAARSLKRGYRVRYAAIL